MTDGQPTAGERELRDDEIEAIHESARSAATHHHLGRTMENPYAGDPTAATLWHDAYGYHVRNQR